MPPSSAAALGSTNIYWKHCTLDSVELKGLQLCPSSLFGSLAQPEKLPYSFE